MNRRGFLKSMLAAGTAPYVAKLGVLMPVTRIWTPADSLFSGEIGTYENIRFVGGSGGFIVPAQFAKVLRPGLEKVFAQWHVDTF